MDTNTLLAVFTGVTVVAFVLQCVALLWMARSIRQLSSRLEALGKDLGKAVKSFTEGIGGLTANVKAVTDKVQLFEDHIIATGEIIHKRASEIDAFLGETTDAVRLQVIRIQDTVDTASRQVEETFQSLHRSVLAPISEINAILIGVRVGLDYLLRRRKVPAATRPQDEEMFI